MAKTYGKCKLCGAESFLNYAGLCKRCNSEKGSLKIKKEVFQDKELEKELKKKEQAAMTEIVPETKEEAPAEKPKEEAPKEEAKEEAKKEE
jgi:hypothetical protein